MGAPIAASLVVRIRGRRCALPIEIVGETMRVLPIEPIAGAPVCLRGTALIRGAVTSVIDLGALLDGAQRPIGRLVTLRAARALALAVEEVGGVEGVAAGSQLLSAEALAALAAIDSQLPVLLGRGTRLPEAAV